MRYEYLFVRAFFIETEANDNIGDGRFASGGGVVQALVPGHPTLAAAVVAVVVRGAVQI